MLLFSLSDFFPLSPLSFYGKIFWFIFSERGDGFVHVVREKAGENPDGPFRLAFLGDGSTDFQLELTWLSGRSKPYDLGECEFHLAFSVPDLTKAHALHEKMGCICYENQAMGIYFITDPDGYWIEIIPEKR